VSVPSDAELVRKLAESRLRVLREQPFFGLLLMHMRYGLDEDCETAGTDGTRILFGPAFLGRLSPLETDFMLLHEIAHVALGHCFRGDDRVSETFHLACDLVVNSMLLTELTMFEGCQSLDGKSIRHLIPGGDEAALYSAEEVYEMLGDRRVIKKNAGAANGTEGEKGEGEGEGKGKGRSKGKGKGGKGEGGGGTDGLLDDHSLWGEETVQEQKRLREEWDLRMLQAALTVEIQRSSNSCGDLPLLAQRLLGELRRPQTDWRTLLRDFLQQEVTDYGFTPPDRRFQDSPFILPDWSEIRETPGKLWFFVDCSGSISDEDLTGAFTEIIGALEEFGGPGGRLDAVLSFFDAGITDPAPFGSVRELLRLRPWGGGGTSFDVIFDSLKKHLANVQPRCLIILTDGHADFPPESAALHLPVLWLVNNEAVTPPWGKVARWVV
jgi:predicted metal-dependent peptidase